jgi:hypothetical protein
MAILLPSRWLGMSFARNDQDRGIGMAEQLFWLAMLGLAAACISWTATREEITREPREWLTRCGEQSPHWWTRKLCYMFTCEYCFSHYVAAGLVVLTDFRMLLEDWRGYLLAWLALVAVANVYMSSYSRLRVEIKKERAALEETETRRDDADDRDGDEHDGDGAGRRASKRRGAITEPAPP